MRAAGDMNFAEGTLWSEGGAGTNAIGTAIALDHAVQVFGPEHFTDPVQRWTCSAAPIHDPDTGAVIGVIDLTGDLSTVHPHSLAVATATAAPSRRASSWCCRSATRACTPATATASRPAARALMTPSGPRDPAPSRPAGASSAGSRSRPAAARWSSRRRARGRRAGLPHARGLRRARRRAPRVTPPRGRSLKLGFLGRDRATLEIDDRHTELRPRLAEILALLCAHPTG